MSLNWQPLSMPTQVMVFYAVKSFGNLPARKRALALSNGKKAGKSFGENKDIISKNFVGP